MRREARLRVEHAHLYPGVEPGVWESAAVLGEKVLACRLLLPSSGFILSDRALNAGHFEFRGGSISRVAAPERLVEDPRAVAADAALSGTL
ncbi:MAG: hypothetical protein ACJ8DC_08625 [Gemmatimonadales bacterium]